MRSTVPALAVAVLLLAACGGGSAASNGEASKSAAQVLKDAQKAATGASSVHVAGKIVSNGTNVSIDLALVKDKGATGSVTDGGLDFKIIRIGDEVYIQGSNAFLKHFAGSAASLLEGKWLKGSATTGQLASLSSLTEATQLFAEIHSQGGTLTNKGETTYNGQKAVEIDSSKGGKLYVAATGTPYPIALVGPGTDSGAITFGDFNASVSLTAPKNALDISAFGG